MRRHHDRAEAEVSDAALVAAVRSGDRTAFERLVVRYGTAVRAVAHRVVRDHHVSEDVAQDTFVLAYRRLASLRVASLFGRWVLKIARHQAVRAVNGNRRDVPIEHAASVAARAAAAAAAAPAEAEHLLGELAKLPEREQRLLMLRYFNGHTVEEIARITGRPVGTVTKQLSRGYARLRERLTEALT